MQVHFKSVHLNLKEECKECGGMFKNLLMHKNEVRCVVLYHVSFHSTKTSVMSLLEGDYISVLFIEPLSI